MLTIIEATDEHVIDRLYRGDALEPPILPLGWYSRAAFGGVDLRVVARGRKYIAVGAAVLGFIAGWRTFLNWQIVPPSSLAPWLGITLLLSLFAIWCSFADELWHIEKNYLRHQAGIGRWVHSRDYRDADLKIEPRFSTNFSVPYYRLYAVVNGRSRFLMERRKEEELCQLATFISFHAGWRILP